MELAVKYIGVGTLEGYKIIASFSPEKSIKDSVTPRQVKKEVENLLSSSHEGEWATRSPSSMGVWFLQSDENSLIYFSLVKSGYSDRFASALLSDLKSLFSSQGADHLKSSPSESYTSIMASDMRKLHAKYNDTASLDKIQNVNARVLEVKSLA